MHCAVMQQTRRHDHSSVHKVWTHKCRPQKQPPATPLHWTGLQASYQPPAASLQGIDTQQHGRQLQASQGPHAHRLDTINAKEDIVAVAYIQGQPLPSLLCSLRFSGSICSCSCGHASFASFSMWLYPKAHVKTQHALMTETSRSSTILGPPEHCTQTGIPRSITRLPVRSCALQEDWRGRKAYSRAFRPRRRTPHQPHLFPLKNAGERLLHRLCTALQPATPWHGCSALAHGAKDKRGVAGLTGSLPNKMAMEMMGTGCAASELV